MKRMTLKKLRRSVFEASYKRNIASSTWVQSNVLADLVYKRTEKASAYVPDLARRVPLGKTHERNHEVCRD